jgi:CBS-domain-containing membrane protein
MLDHGLHHLPVLDARGSVVGVISDSDLVATSAAGAV